MSAPDKRWSPSVAPVALAAALALTCSPGCAGRQPITPSDRDPPSALQASTAPTTIRAEGLVTTATGATVTVAAEAEGRVVSAPVVEGDRVLAGEVLAALDDSEERAALGEAQAQVGVYQAELAFLERHYARVDSLVRGGHIAVEQLDVVTRDRAVARAQLRAAQDEVDRLEAVLAKRTVRSPLTGRVISRQVEPGQMVMPGTPLFTIADLSRRRVKAEVDESDVARIKVGEPASITADGYGGQSWRGRVVKIPEEVVPSSLRPQDPTRPSDTRVILVKITVPPAAPFKLGQRVELRIGTARDATGR